MIIDDVYELDEIVGEDGRSQTSDILDWGEAPVRKIKS